MKGKLLTIIFGLFALFQVSANEGYRHLFFTVVNSGEGGAILGHTYLTFCPDMVRFELQKCKAIEYNLDINIGDKFEELKSSGILKKIDMFKNANYRIYEYENALEFSMKYIERDQSIEFYHLNMPEESISRIHQDLLQEKERRNFTDIKDYETLDNNCVTVLIDHINKYSEVEILKESDEFLDMDNHIFQFPIFVKDRLIESRLVDFMLFKSQGKSYSTSF